MTRVRHAAGALLLAIVLMAAAAGCDGGSASGDGTDGGNGRDGGAGATSTTSATPTTATPAARAWVGTWRPVLTDEYAPAQQAFLGAVESAQTADVQQGARQLGAASAALLQAVRAAGPAPAPATRAADRLETGLAIEVALIDEVLRVCTGADDTCREAVSRYADNNSQEIVPALVALGV